MRSVKRDAVYKVSSRFAGSTTAVRADPAERPSALGIQERRWRLCCNTLTHRSWWYACRGHHKHRVCHHWPGHSPNSRKYVSACFQMELALVTSTLAASVLVNFAQCIHMSKGNICGVTYILPSTSSSKQACSVSR